MMMMTPDEIFMNDIPEDRLYTAAGIGIMIGRLRTLIMQNKMPLSEAVTARLNDALDAAYAELEAKARPKPDSR